MLKISENNGTEEIGLVTPTPGVSFTNIVKLRLGHVWVITSIVFCGM